MPGYTVLILTPAYQFFAGYRELLVTVNYRLQRPGTGQSCLITPLTSLLSVLDLTGKIIDFTLTKKVVDSQTSFHHVRPGVSQLTNNNYCVSAAPCRRVAWGKESVKCEKLCQPHQTGPQQEQRDLDHCHQTSVRRDRKCLSDYQMSQMWNRICL